MGLEAAIDGATTVWQVEQDPYARRVLERHWPDVDRSCLDVRKGNRQTLAPVDLICGGFPCQSISVAGKQDGFKEGSKSSLWFEMSRIIGDLRPRFVVLENVPAITSIDGGRVLGRVLGDLAQMGYDAEWHRLGASDVGAPHRRWRWFLIGWLPVADPLRRGRPHRQTETGEIWPQFTSSGPQLADPLRLRQPRPGQPLDPGNSKTDSKGQTGNVEHVRKPGPWEIEPQVGRVVNGVPDGAHINDRLRCLGNAVVPQCAYVVGQRLQVIRRVIE
jgi:DNA (cytosine-5)-methyltransferase 1